MKKLILLFLLLLSSIFSESLNSKLAKIFYIYGNKIPYEFSVADGYWHITRNILYAQEGIVFIKYTDENKEEEIYFLYRDIKKMKKRHDIFIKRIGIMFNEIRDKYLMERKKLKKELLQ